MMTMSMSGLLAKLPVCCDRLLLLNGNDDEYERSITWLGYLFGSVRVVIVRILAGRTLRFAAMADASAFSIYNLSEPLRVVYYLLTTQVVFLLLVLSLFLLLILWIIWDSNSVSVAYYLARLRIWNGHQNAVRSRGSDCDIPVVFSLIIALLRNKMMFERTHVPQTTWRPSAIRLRDQEDPHDDDHPEGDNSNQEHDDDFDFWTDSYASNDDEIPTKQVSQDIMEEISLTIDEAKLKKMVDEMIRQRCTLRDEHQYHIDQMKNFLQSDIVWESRKEILDSPCLRKATPLVLSCQRNPDAPALSLINQDLLYLKKGNSGPEKIVLSLYKFPVVIFNDDDIEERTSRWVNKCVKKFNPYARYGVEHWKNPHAKIFYIKKQKEPGRPKEEIYSNSKIVQVIKTYWELGHEHKFITKIVARRANYCIVSITEPDYKNLNTNDIEDIYLLIINGKVTNYADTGLLWSLSVFIRSSVIWERVHDFQLGIESYQQKVNLTAPIMTFPGIEEYEVFSIVYEPVHGIIYKNSKKEKRVMRHSEIHKFCDATLMRVLEGLKSYNNDVKYGYVQKELTSDEVEYLKLFEEEIEVRLKYQNQMRRWEMYVNGRPLGPRRERPE
ncbi:hypothetical protein Tco_1458810 [Tanacetum coccineum]